MAGGPDDNVPLDPHKNANLKVTAGQSGVIQFKSEAAWEQAICIYDDAGRKVAEKGTYASEGRDMNDWDVPTSTSDISYLVTGWHKQGPPLGSLPWIQSNVQVSVDSSDNSISFNYEDGPDSDFNDIVATYRPL
ncbi:hypothetical protein [Paenibacillus sp. FSL P2-0173]|uniref:hypothetical protein n=1 Tax=Paenibacillus sp. FSL P2-0173 TaxID=2921627 RepID=UPI0030F9C448